jgi:TP53 regulating kinase-like protein
MFEIGKAIGKLHKENIIHGDLTTSNMIYKDKKIFLIDFGLGYFNGKYEDKGVDIHLLKQALEAKHFKKWKTLFNEFEIGYRSIEPKEAEKVFNKMKAIEKRGRYKH